MHSMLIFFTDSNTSDNTRQIFKYPSRIFCGFGLSAVARCGVASPSACQHFTFFFVRALKYLSRIWPGEILSGWMMFYGKHTVFYDAWICRIYFWCFCHNVICQSKNANGCHCLLASARAPRHRTRLVCCRARRNSGSRQACGGKNCNGLVYACQGCQIMLFRCRMLSCKHLCAFAPACGII